MNTGPMDCNELVELVTAYLDEALDPDTRARFDAHLTECEGCENYLQQFRATVRTLGKQSFDTRLENTDEGSVIGDSGDDGVEGLSDARVKNDGGDA